MHSRILLSILLSSSLWLATALGDASTPAVGSPERKAICDAVRAHVLKQAEPRKTPVKVLFQVGHLRVDGAWAWFEGFPVGENGKALPDGYLADIDYMMVLRRTKAGWIIFEDQSRGDVPGDEEIAALRTKLKDVPTSIVPQMWRKFLRR